MVAFAGKSQVYLLVRGKARRVDAQREAAEQALIRAHVNAVLLDEGHRLMQGGGRYTTDEQLEWLKSLTNRTNVLHVLASPYELFRFRNTRGQLARRGRDLHFARYHVERTDERKEFVAAVKYLLERVPLEVDLNVLLRRPGKAGNGKAPSQMEKMPGLQHHVQTEQAAGSVPASTSLPQVAPKSTKARVGERRPGRDPVGETSATPTRTSTGYAFSGKIELLARQMEADAVFHIECPACLAVREINPKGDSIMFSWHIKRVTTTPQHGKRWVRRGNIW